MNHLNARAILHLGSLLIVVAIALFAVAATINYWQGWVFLVVFDAATIAITVDLMAHDPQLLERRINAGPRAEQQTRQKVIQALAIPSVIALFLFPAVDHRFGWSSMPPAVSLLGDAAVAYGFFLVFKVFRENSYAAAIIQVARGQHVISTGPYSITRHPMYSGALLMFFGVPLALGSWWGLLLVIPMTIVLIVRLVDEEIYLAGNLAGYAEYRTKTRWRLIPWIF